MNGEIKEKIQRGDKIFNFTIGDFDPSIFAIPLELEEEIIYAYRKHFTNYPAGEGDAELRKSIARFILEREGLDYGMDYARFRRIWRFYLLLLGTIFATCDGEYNGNGQYLLHHTDA
jgi:hypothetical protein